MTPTNLITLFAHYPKSLFLMNLGVRIKLRAQTPGQTSSSYDIIASNNIVHPKALDPSTYEGPNGVQMLPNSPSLQKLAKSLADSPEYPNAILFEIPEGTIVPRDLLLIHEKLDRYSLQPGVQMSLDHLNGKITSLMKTKARVWKPARFLKKHPFATTPSTDPEYHSMSKAAKKAAGIQGYTQLPKSALKEDENK